jgi:DMSO/TMAO reductase YedYZ molybdopterin-dependent catalytic subunit
MESALPPGQFESAEFPRFGLPRYASRFPRLVEEIRIEVVGEVEHPITLSDELDQLPRVHQVSDFHCVTTWSHRSILWRGFRFADFYETCVVPRARPQRGAVLVVLRSQDGYRTSLPLSDLLASDVLLADCLNGKTLTIEHGAPLRLVAPAHYGYKNAKHVSRVEFWRDDREYRPAGFRFMDHPRARVVLEERGRAVPGWILRYLYRPLVGPTAAHFRRELDRYLRANSGLGGSRDVVRHR